MITIMVIAIVIAGLMTWLAAREHREWCREYARNVDLATEVIRQQHRIRQFEGIVAADDELLEDAGDLQHEARGEVVHHVLDLFEQMALKGVPADQQIDHAIDWLQSQVEVSTVTAFLERLHQHESLRPADDPNYRAPTSHRSRPEP